MFKELKEMLLNQVDCIADLLEFYGFEGIQLKQREIRFKRDAEGGLNISIKLEDNPSLLVHDFARGISTDIFAYIVKEKDQKLGNVLNKVKSVLKLENNWAPQKRKELFDGLYNRIAKKTSQDELLPEYPKDVLDNYLPMCNRRFQRDGISFETQRIFEIGFDICSQRITIPLYDELGRLVGVKGRINQSDIDEFTPKYLYLKECQASKYLYGYFQNYQFLFGNEVVVGESEKMVMQAHSFGVRNVVGIGSNALSTKQARLLLQLNPSRIIFALDEGLDLEQTERNLRVLQSVMGAVKPEVYYWDYHKNLKVKGTKNSPTDMGKEMYENIINNELVKIL